MEPAGEERGDDQDIFIPKSLLAGAELVPKSTTTSRRSNQFDAGGWDP